EDGDVTANSERQSQHANEKKSRRLYKCSRSITQIGDEIFHNASSMNVADVFMPNRKFHKFIIITIIVPFGHDSVIRRVPSCSTAPVKPPRLNSLGSRVLEQRREKEVKG